MMSCRSLAFLGRFSWRDGSPGHGQPDNWLPGARDGQTEMERCCRGVPNPGPRLAQGGVVRRPPTDRQPSACRTWRVAHDFALLHGLSSSTAVLYSLPKRNAPVQHVSLHLHRLMCDLLVSSFIFRWTCAELPRVYCTTGR